ncbi:MAG TPA: Wzz/FepE/Etk N-terminal domain-containing protein [Solirubrobacteraceae bacterium]|jgi:Mrp family chromosome partitioning ATPase/alkylhydroperoxidase/carboxymuconolactone decarboxylase family protein YurZ|nr:Wzz/FepE/Etk N-terminal domain-containing protein [Solirubrobacteraceae bacterium]
MNDTTDATAILAPLWRRKWMILIVALLVAVGSYLYYKRQPTVFQASTQVFLGAGAEEQFTEKGAGKSTTINAANQTTIINSIVVEATKRQLRKTHKHLYKAAASGVVRAKSAEKSQFVTLTAEAPSARAAALLANSVAKTYIKRDQAQYQRGVKAAIEIARRQLRRIETPRVTPGAKGKGSTLSATNVIQGATLNSKINQLEAELGIVGVQQVKPATPHNAVLLAPLPKKNAIFGFVIGLVLASIAAFALSRFNRRLRSLADIEAVIQTQVLTALPKVGRPIVQRDGQPTPSRALLEPLRRLHTTLQLGNVLEQERQAPPRSVLFISADAGDGKSTLAAGLALVQREAGERAAIVEADFRRPVQAKLLGLGAPRGLADALTGTASVAEALQSVPSHEPEPVVSQQAGPGPALATAVAPSPAGAVSVLVGATSVVNPPALTASTAMGEVLRSLGEDYDSVLIDAPSPLEVSDVVPLLGAVDAIVIVARIGHTRETSAQRLLQLLMRTPSAPVIGVVANGVTRKDSERYGISLGGRERSWLAKLTRR